MDYLHQGLATVVTGIYTIDRSILAWHVAGMDK
jgi:hypothetical protein